MQSPASPSSRAYAPVAGSATIGGTVLDGQVDRNDGGSLSRADEADTAERHRFILNLLLFNAAAFALLGAAWVQGWVDAVVRADVTSITIGIFVVFVGGLLACAREAWNLAIELKGLRDRHPDRRRGTGRYLSSVAGREAGSRAIIAQALRNQLASRIAIVRYIANALVLMGLIGTVVGFVIALTAVDPETTADVNAIGPMVARLLQGMSVALYTTLVGTVLHLWLSANHHILAVAMTNYASRLIARGEQDA